ncbi:MAG: HEAT repeat domain-containing protein [Planctomycetota bacterium]
MLCILGSCGAAPPAERQDSTQPDEEKKRLIEESARLRKENIRLHKEILRLKLTEARRREDESEELRLLVEDGLRAPYPEIQTHALAELGKLAEERRKKAVPLVCAEIPAMPPAVHAEAVAFLSRTGTGEAEEQILASAGDASPAVRAAAAEALGHFPDERSVNALHSLLEDADPGVRKAALDSIQTIRNPRSVEVLIAFANREPDQQLRESTIDALGNIGHPGAVPTLTDILRKNAPKGTHYAAINSLGKIGVLNDEVRRAIEPFLEGEQPVDIREIAILALGKFKDVAMLPRLREHLRSDEPRLRAAAFRAIALMADSMILENDLLPAFLDEKDSSASNGMWSSLTTFAGDSFPHLVRIGEYLLEAPAGFLPRLEEITQKLEALDPTRDEKRQKRYAALLEGVAKAQEEAGQHRPAAAHHRKLSALYPDDPAHLASAARCYVKLMEYESAVSALEEALKKTEKGSPGWWRLQVDVVEAKRLAGDPAAAVAAAFALLRTTPRPSDRAILARARDAHTEAAVQLIRRLRVSEHAAAADRSIRDLGRAMIGPIADAVESAHFSDLHSRLVALGNAITGTSFDAVKTALDGQARARAADAWRAWLKNNP